MIIVADTSALIAAFDPDQDYHKEAREILRTESLSISPLVMTEFDHIVHRLHGYNFASTASDQIIEDLGDGVHRLAQITTDDFTMASRVRNAYSSLELDLADTVGVALAAKYRTNKIFTLDQRDFRTVKPLTPEFDHFEILPIDCA